MGTKLNPGAYDCFHNAEPDEPMFVLLGRDQDAPALVSLWAILRELDGESPTKVAEARECAAAMESWAKKLGRSPLSLDEAISCAERRLSPSVRPSDFAQALMSTIFVDAADSQRRIMNEVCHLMLHTLQDIALRLAAATSLEVFATDLKKVIAASTILTEEGHVGHYQRTGSETPVAATARQTPSPAGQ